MDCVRTTLDAGGSHKIRANPTGLADVEQQIVEHGRRAAEKEDCQNPTPRMPCGGRRNTSKNENAATPIQEICRIDTEAFMVAGYLDAGFAASSGYQTKP